MFEGKSASEAKHLICAWRSIMLPQFKLHLPPHRTISSHLISSHDRLGYGYVSFEKFVDAAAACTRGDAKPADFDAHLPTVSVLISRSTGACFYGFLCLCDSHFFSALLVSTDPSDLKFRLVFSKLIPLVSVLCVCSQTPLIARSAPRS